MLLAQAREARVILDAVELVFLADIGERVDSALDVQALTTIAIFQTDDIHAFDSECDEAPTTSAVFMSNLTSYDLNVLSESLKTQMDVLEKELFEKQDKYIEEIVDLEKKEKALDNIVYKTGQTVQTMDMLTKPQVFYDNTHKKSLGYQNPLYLCKAQRIQLVLYSGSALAKKHDAIFVIDIEETLRLAEESRIKMQEKQNDPIVKKKKVNITLIDYTSLNKLYERLVPQKHLSAE
ncbi:hypothetical protein Tco_1549236 [Tanacetum coccineum]